MTFIYLDIETTGLDPMTHQVAEIAFAVENGPVHSGVVRHDLIGADPKALEINRYHERGIGSVEIDGDFEQNFFEAVHGATIVGANPAFDTAFLRVRWGKAPWKYRLLDVEAYAMPVLGLMVPKGLAYVSDELRKRGFDIPQPDHSAAADVETTRACFTALDGLATKMRVYTAGPKVKDAFSITVAAPTDADAFARGREVGAQEAAEYFRRRGGRP